METGVLRLTSALATSISALTASGSILIGGRRGVKAERKKNFFEVQLGEGRNVSFLLSLVEVPEEAIFDDDRSSRLLIVLKSPHFI